MLQNAASEFKNQHGREMRLIIIHGAGNDID